MMETAEHFEPARASLEKKPVRSASPAVSDRDEIGKIIANELQKAIDSFRDPKKGIKLLSRKMDIHEKTLRRLLRQEHHPGYITIYKIYRALSSTTNDTELLEKVPPIVREYLIKNNPQPQVGNQVVYMGDLEKELISDRVFAEIYILAGCGAVRRDEILDRYGKYGISLLEKMCSRGILKEVSPNLFMRGNKQVNLTARGLKQAGLFITDSFADSERGDEYVENYLAFYSEGLSEDAYKEWILIDEEAFEKKLNVCKKPMALGSIRAFTFMATDKMLLSPKDKDKD